MEYVFWGVGVGVFIFDGPGEMVGSRMMPAGSDSTNSGSWRELLNLSPERDSVGDGSNEPAARPTLPSPVDIEAASTSINPGPISQEGTNSDEEIKRLSDWVTNRFSLLGDLINALRKEEHMRPLAPYRLQYVVECLEEEFDIDEFDEIINDLKTKGVNSDFYKK